MFLHGVSGASIDICSHKEEGYYPTHFSTKEFLESIENQEFLEFPAIDFDDKDDSQVVSSQKKEDTAVGYQDEADDEEIYTGPYDEAYFSTPNFKHIESVLDGIFGEGYTRRIMESGNKSKGK